MSLELKKTISEAIDYLSTIENYVNKLDLCLFKAESILPEIEKNQCELKKDTVQLISGCNPMSSEEILQKISKLGDWFGVKDLVELKFYNSTSTVCDHIRKGIIPPELYIKHGRTYLFNKKLLAEYIDNAN